MKSVAIIGAGITGLTAAFYLKRKGVAVTVFEVANRAGGVIQSRRQNGFLAEFGPNTILETSPKISQLVRDLNLESRKIYPDPNAKKRFIVHRGKPMAVPGSPMEFLTTKLFSAPAKMALIREPFVPARHDGFEESVAEFVTRRLNREFLERAIDPMIAGIYAGDPQKLSVQHAFPKLFALEQKYGSLIRGQIFGAKDKKKSGEIPRNRARLFSFDEGLQVLTDALAAELRDSLKFNSPVTKLTKIENGWRISTDNEEMEHSAIIFCGTANALAKLKIDAPLIRPPATFSPSDGEKDGMRGTFQFFSEIRYAPVASVVLGFRREDVAHPLDGFGMLIPKIEHFKILGTIFSSSLFPNRAPKNFVTLASYIGGERHPELTLKSPDEIVELTLADLRKLLGVRGAPVFKNVALYPTAIPQYNVGYGKFKEWMSEIENQFSGLFFAGHYRDGVALSDSILSGCRAAEKISAADDNK